MLDGRSGVTSVDRADRRAVKLLEDILRYMTGDEQ